jgi:hypothetical protein
MDGGGLDIPGSGSAPDEQAVAFAAELIDRSGKAPVIEAALAHRSGRRRPLPVRAVLTALLCLALDDRPLFLTDATRLLFGRLPETSRIMLGVLPGAQDPHLGGVHDAEEEPGISGGVVGKVPGHVGEVPDSRQILGGDCCVRAGAGRERRGRLSRPGPWSAADHGSAR